MLQKNITSQKIVFFIITAAPSPHETAVHESPFSSLSIYIHGNFQQELHVTFRKITEQVGQKMLRN
jgi:hypothetical protein